jgi:hypothetical protein
MQRTTTDEERAEIARLLRRAAVLTRRMDSAAQTRERNARARAALWLRAMSLGASSYDAARAAGIHHSQVAKALERYGNEAS